MYFMAINMKQLIDFIPLVVFFILYKTHDIYVATGALIIATAIQVAVTWMLYKKVEKMQLVTFVMVAVFGGLTIFLHDDNFIKWKVTIVYGIFAAGLAISQYMGKPLIKGMLGNELGPTGHCLEPDQRCLGTVFRCMCGRECLYCLPFAVRRVG